MNWASIAILLLAVVDLCLAAYQHGKPAQPRNFWTALIASIISLVLIYFAGGFR